MAAGAACALGSSQLRVAPKASAFLSQEEPHLPHHRLRQPVLNLRGEEAAGLLCQLRGRCMSTLRVSSVALAMLC